LSLRPWRTLRQAMTGIGFRGLVLITMGRIHARDVSVKGLGEESVEKDFRSLAGGLFDTLSKTLLDKCFKIGYTIYVIT